MPTDSEKSTTPSLMTRALGYDPAQEVDLTIRPRFNEQIIQTLLFIGGMISIFTTVGVVFVLGEESLRFFLISGEVDIVEFFTNTVWKPTIGEYGIIPLITATLMTSFIAMIVALPLGLGAAIYLSEYASERTRGILKPILEVLAGIPTVVYGYFAITFMTPLLQGIFGNIVGQYNTASAGIVVGILIIPLISSLSEDALSSVPSSLRQASYGLGATKQETISKVVLPAALSGIVAAFIIAVSRAIGETMIVAMAAGAGANFTFNPFDPAQTMTGYIASISGGDVSYDTPDYNSIFAIGLTLFVITLTLNIISRAVTERFKEAY